MIHLFDANNVRLRAMTKPQMSGQKRLSLRQTYIQMISGTDKHIWCWDGKGHNQRRIDIYPDYKQNREPMSEDHFSQIRLFKELLTHSSATQINCVGWEADDVVATLARKFATNGETVLCHSNDLDYFQLEANPRITINGIQKRPCEANQICLFKALCGDSSDNISGIPGFGPKAWEKILPHLDAIIDGICKANPHAFASLPFTPRVRTWLQDADNLQLLQNMFLITHMFTVPDDDLSNGVTVGVVDTDKAEALLSRYFL